ncbi:hypothetical protein H5410_052841 [Solanum commersonii]|uniref:Uncharacterized protein n=1 Tax=Solanum commersonii TaxID=4109 RepID=A0A9J5X4R9_SOLCO|nr:hypothetical protein H5410_052841 [Solanum commersonii]
MKKLRKRTNSNLEAHWGVFCIEPSRVNISKRASVLTTHSAHQSHNASTHVAPQSSYTISTPTMGQCNTLNTSSGSIGLSNLHLESNGSEPNTPTTQHSDAHSPQPGDRDNFRRLIIEPLEYNLRPDVGMAKIILKCIGTHYNDVYPNWSSIPFNTQGQMFNEFKEKELGSSSCRSEIFKEYRSTYLESRGQTIYTKKTRIFGNESGEPIRGSIYGYPKKAYQKKKSWYCGSSSSSFDSGDKETISAMETCCCSRKREEERRKREEEIAAAREVENKRYAALQAQQTFLFESGNILPPCPDSSDENDKSDKETKGDENGKSDKESESN